VPQWLTRSDNPRRQIVQSCDNVGTILDRVLSTDRLDFAFAPLFDRNTHTVTTNQTPAFIGDNASRLLQIK
jgi:hypothetical protein